MRILIDGYNLIGRLPALKRHFPHDLERTRQELNDLLRRFKRVKGHGITVVYDGPGGMWGRQESSKTAGIKEIFTSAGEQADDVIIRMAKKDSDALIVVSEDRRVADACRKSGAAVMSASEFDSAVMEALYMGEKGCESSLNEHHNRGSKKKGPSRRLPRKKRKELKIKKKL